MEKDAILNGIIEKMRHPDWTLTQGEYAVLMAEMDARLAPAPADPAATRQQTKDQHEVGLTKEEIEQLKVEG